jgi:hypothetical protein
LLTEGQADHGDGGCVCTIVIRDKQPSSGGPDA